MTGEGTRDDVSVSWPPDLVETYRDQQAALLRCAYLICGSRSAAPDIVHDALESVARRWDTVENGSAYLFAAVANRARDHLRRSARSATDEWRDEPEPPPPVEEWLDLWDALARLSPDHRTAIVLRYHGGWSDQEIAVAMGRRAATIRSWRHRALTTLRKELGPR